MTNDAWPQVAGYAARHHGVIGSCAAAGLGASASTIARWVELERVRRPAPGVLVVAGAPPTWRQRVAVAAVSGGALASHRAGAALRELDGFPPRQVEVLTLHGRRRKRSAWIVHESRTLRGADVDEVDGIPCTTIARTLIDLPATSHPFLVAQALDHACRRRPGTLEEVVARHLELTRRGRRGVRLLDRLLEERLGTGRFAGSGFETKTVTLVRRAGLPDPVLQHAVRDRRLRRLPRSRVASGAVGGRVRQPGAPLGQASPRVGPRPAPPAQAARVGHRRGDLRPGHPRRSRDRGRTTRALRAPAAVVRVRQPTFWRLSQRDGALTDARTVGGVTRRRRPGPRPGRGGPAGSRRCR